MAAPARLPTIVERDARRRADQAANTAIDLTTGFAMIREGTPATPRGNADLLGRVDDLIVQWQIVRARLAEAV